MTTISALSGDEPIELMLFNQRSQVVSIVELLQRSFIEAVFQQPCLREKARPRDLREQSGTAVNFAGQPKSQ